MRACNTCVHFMSTNHPEIQAEPICLLEFHFYNAFNWEWFQPTEYYEQPNTRCPHYRAASEVQWPAAHQQ